MSLLNEIQQKLKVPKSQYNAFAKYNYRNAEDILEAVKPLLGGGTLVLEDEVVSVGGQNYVKATARLVYRNDDMAGGGYVWEATGWAREPKERKGMDDSQITGATSSYARKYALNGLFCIDDTKDADSVNNAAPAKEQPKQPFNMTADQKVKADKERILAQLKILGLPCSDKEECTNSVASMTGLLLIEPNYEKIIGLLESIISENKSSK